MRKINFCSNWTVKDTSSGNIMEVILPHDAMILNERDKNSSAQGAGGFYPGGDYEYSTKLHVPMEYSQKTYVLEFEGMYQRGQIFVNGCFVGAAYYSYSRLLVDITAYLNYGCENEILVKVMNSNSPNSRWYTGSGLYRPVWLHVGGEVRICPDGLKVMTPEADSEVAQVKTEIRLAYDGKRTRNLKVATIIKDSEGNTIATENTPVSIFGGYVPEITQRIYISKHKLWSTEDPNLYTCETKVLEDDMVLDEAESTFGIRKITIDSIRGLRINNKEVLLRGACIHHDNGPLGAATFARAEERRVELLKKAGFNAIRSAHNPASKALLDACDRFGVLVIDEVYDMWNNSKSRYDYAQDFAAHWQSDIRDIVEKDFNHPCVFMYSIGNEIQELGNLDGKTWNRHLADQIRGLDSTRVVTNGINGLVGITFELPQILMDYGEVTSEQLPKMFENADDTESGGGINDLMTALMGGMNRFASHPLITDRLVDVCASLDVCGLNYMRDAYEAYQKQFPNRVFYGSETLPPDIDLNWAKVKEIPACLGDFTWTGWDYIGESGIGVVTYDEKTVFMKDYPVYLGYCGDHDIIGNRRPISYYREIVYGLRKEPYIAVQLPEHYKDTPRCTPWVNTDSVSSWNWNGYEGKPCFVEVYADADEAELLINGKSYGKQPVGEANRFKAIFDVLYEPGIVETIAFKDGAEIGRYALNTAGKAAKIQLEADRDVLQAGEQDLSYVMISVTDAEGRLNTDQNCEVNVSVEGDGTLIALGSADPKSTENFFSQKRTTYYGKALAIIRSGIDSGVITVRVTAEGFKTQEIKIQVK